MNSPVPLLNLPATVRLSTPDTKRTAGGFSKLINDNRAVFKRHFGVDLFPGSLNVDCPAPMSLQQDLDAGKPPPAFVIPRAELINMPDYIGDGQTWPCLLHGPQFSAAIECWVFRRVGSKVPKGVLEIVAPIKLVDAFGLQHGDAIRIDLIAREDAAVVT